MQLDYYGKEVELSANERIELFSAYKEYHEKRGTVLEYQMSDLREDSMAVEHCLYTVTSDKNESVRESLPEWINEVVGVSGEAVAEENPLYISVDLGSGQVFDSHLDSWMDYKGKDNEHKGVFLYSENSDGAPIVSPLNISGNQFTKEHQELLIVANETAKIFSEKVQNTSVNMKLPFYSADITIKKEELDSLYSKNKELKDSIGLDSSCSKDELYTLSLLKNGDVSVVANEENVQNLIYDFTYINQNIRREGQEKISLPEWAQSLSDGWAELKGDAVQGHTMSLSDGKEAFVVPCEKDMSWYAVKDSNKMSLVHNSEITKDGIREDIVPINERTLLFSKISSLDLVKNSVASDTYSPNKDIGVVPLFASKDKENVVSNDENSPSKKVKNIARIKK